MKIKITVILYILIFCCALYGTNVTWSLLQDKTFQKTGYISAESYDENLIFEGLEPAKTVQDTFRWYVGRWCGQIPFFRPITSQLFWLEYRIFGKTNFHWWLGVALLCHIAAMLLAYEVLARLLQDKLVAAFTIVLFSCPPIVHGFMIRNTMNDHWKETIPFWKNSPEYWGMIVISATILAFLCRKYWLALSLSVLAIGVKETGFATIPILFMVSWYHGQRAPKWFWGAGFSAASALFLYRRLVLGTFGYTLGSNNAWWYRLLRYIGGSIGEQLATGDYHVLVAGTLLGLVALSLLFQKNKDGSVSLYRPFALAIGSMVIGTIVTQDYFVRRFADSITWDRAFLVTYLENAVGITHLVLLVVGAYLVVRHQLKEFLLMAGIVLATSLGLFMAAQVTKHAFYLPDIFKMSFFALALRAAYRHFELKQAHFFPTRKARGTAPLIPRTQEVAAHATSAGHV